MDLDARVDLALKLHGKVSDRLDDGPSSFISAFLGRAGAGLHRRDVWETIWCLVSRRLAYIDVDPRGLGSWELRLTSIGQSAKNDRLGSPDNPSRYIARFGDDLPDLARPYVVEALDAYGAGTYRAAAVMVGVASEAVFIELAGAFCSWLDGRAQEKFRDVLDDPRTGVAAKFKEFRSRLEPRRSDLPDELGAGLDVFLSSIFDLLRTQRNDLGHPTGVDVSRDECFASLELFVRYCGRAAALARSFRQSNGNAS